MPVAAREIRVAAHDPSLYRGRVWTGALGIGVTIWILYGALNFTGRFNFSVGAQIFAIQAWIAFCFAAGAMQITNDAISSEKRDGTLGLLFLTHLKGHDVVLGKLASSMLLHFSAALATLPILTLPTLLGGVQLAQSFQLLLSLINCMFFSAAAGLLASTLCVNRQRAASLAIAIVVFFCGILPVLTFSMTRKGIYPDLAFAIDLITPFFAQRLSPGALTGPQKMYFYSSLGLVFLFSCAFLTAASLIAPHSWQIREQRPLIGRLRKKFAAWADQTIYSRSPLGRQLLDANAYEWLAARRQSPRIDGWIFLSIVVALAAILILHFNQRFEPSTVQLMVCLPAATILLFNMKTRIGGHACDRFCEDRENNALELILSTPITVPKMIAGEFRALKRLFFPQALLTVPLLFLALFLCLPGIDRLYDLFNTDGTHEVYRLLALIITCWLSIFLFFDAITLAWVGIWLSFRIRKIQMVRGNTMALVFAGPMGAFGAMVAIIENSPFRSMIRGANFYEIGFALAIFAIGGNIWLIRKSRNYLLQTGNDSISKHQFFTREFPNPFAFVLKLLRRGAAG